MNHAAGVVVPIRAFADAKSRLAANLAESERSELMRSMAERVVAAAGSMPVVVVSSAPEVAEWARRFELDVIPDPGSLDDAAAAGRVHVEALGIPRVVVAHADLPRAESLEFVAEPGAARVAVVVPCHRDDGTPVLSIPVDSPFRFAYGPGSFGRHVAEARRVGLEVVEWRDDPSLRHDVDSPDDLARLDWPLAPTRPPR